MTTPPLESWEFASLRDLVYREAGIWLGDTKGALVSSRLQRRLRELGLDSFAAYHRRVLRDPAERQAMIEQICTHETSFFREPRQWEHLATCVYPAWREEGRRAVRALSAGCSTGEEPYSIAMSLLRNGFEARVEAVDLSRRALAQARAAEWPIARAAQLAPDDLRDYMLRGSGDFAGRMRAAPALRQVVHFAQANLVQPETIPRGPFDLVFCRNVLIYFDAVSRRRVLESLVERLAPGGLLLLGHAESLAGGHLLRTVVPTIFMRAAS